MKVAQSISLAFYILIMFASSRHCLINTGCSGLQWFVILGCLVEAFRAHDLGMWGEPADAHASSYTGKVKKDSHTHQANS